MRASTLSPEPLYAMDAYRRAANYLSAGQICLYANPLLKRPLALADVKHLLLEHWGTTPNRYGRDMPEIRYWEWSNSKQKRNGVPFVEVITNGGIIPGIKVDTGAKSMFDRT